MDRILHTCPHVIDGNTVSIVVANKQRSKDCILYIGGLSIDITEEMLKDAFSHFGGVLHSRLLKDPTDGRFKGSGLVHFDSADGVGFWKHV